MVRNKSHAAALSVLLASASIYGIRGMLKIEGMNSPTNNSVFSMIILIALFYVFKFALQNVNRRLCIISGVVGLIFSTCMIFGTNVLLHDHTEVEEIGTWLEILSGSVFFTALIILLFFQLEKYLNRFDASAPNIAVKISHRRFWGVWAIVFMAYLPGLVATYPGIDGYDTLFQLDYYKTGVIDLHHPLIHTYLAGFCAITLGELFGSIEAGFLVYSIFQMLIISGVYAAIFCYIYRKPLPKLVKIAFLLIFMFLPTNALMSFSMTKDVLYSAFNSLTILCILCMYENEKLLKKKSFWIIFNIVTMLGILFRNQGIYVFLFASFVGILTAKKYWKQILIFTIICLIEYGIYSGPITTALGGVKTDGVQEMMSVPCMQLSRAMVMAEDRLTEEERQMIKEYIPWYEIYTINAGISDWMKNGFDSNRFIQNPKEFIKLYINVGLKNPIVYIDAFARLTIGLWYPDMNYRDSQAYHPYWEYIPDPEYQDSERVLGIRAREEGANPIADFYEEISYNNSYQEVPVISMLFSSGILFWFMVIYIGWCVYRREYKFMFPASFMVGIWLTQLLGPVVLYRYIYPLIMATPLFVGTMFEKN